MLFVLICVALLLIVLAAISGPLLFGTSVLPSRGQYDQAVYRDQLREVERDLSRGVLTQEEAGAAQLEIQRRLIATDTAPASWTGTTPGRGILMTATVASCVLLGAGGLYWHLGAPGLPDAPFADRPSAREEAGPGDQHADIKQAAKLLEQKLSAEPSNAAGWVLYARTESILGDWRKAANAYRRGIDLGQKSAAVYAGYGEMQVMAADGIVAPAAHEAFSSALAADPSNAVARFYLALADSQAGEERRAIGAWLELSAGLPADSPMREEIGRRIAAAASSAGIAAPPMPTGLTAEATPSGPTPEQMRAVAEMPPEQRAQMISGMIEQLAAKLKRQPNDLEGWLRLGRAYSVQGETAKAVDAYDHAAALKPGDPAIKLQTVAALLSGAKPGDELPPRAAAMLNEVAAVAPDAPEVLWYLGVVAVREGRVADARDKWTRLLTSLPDGGEDAKMVKAALGELPAK
jgi:cytochrome c-type biogenesis protein CcmH